ncbi:hypothetical protein L227DRAFT_417240 [Lentinus tigrinus ALCF2SS1-6]|uniref:Uncharacterized protein n=1 Tax=Lentinus tigrinus ALCF2SS1-6 TaxID=1328759 RepID=A0A5C2SH98_9APHY|nr:hypothetical protein L227DRAFT_417240 [Lentinus tigrinus ALCF2SS1-6]
MLRTIAGIAVHTGERTAYSPDSGSLAVCSYDRPHLSTAPRGRLTQVCTVPLHATVTTSKKMVSTILPDIDFVFAQSITTLQFVRRGYGSSSHGHTQVGLELPVNQLLPIMFAQTFRWGFDRAPSSRTLCGRTSDPLDCTGEWAVLPRSSADAKGSATLYTLTVDTSRQQERLGHEDCRLTILPRLSACD